MKIIEIFGHPLSGMKSLLIETEKGLEFVHGDWRMINIIIENEN